MPVQPVVDATAWAEKMLRNAANSGADWERGVENPSSSPVAGMKKAKARYKAEMLAALNEGRWDHAVDRLTDEMIASAAKAVGASAFTGGIAARADKIRTAIAKLQPLVAQLKAKLDAMPVDTDQQREAKMIDAKRGMQAIGKQLAGLAR